MIDQNAQLTDLPDFWQEQIRKLRIENKQLRKRVNNEESLDLSVKWQKTLADLRKENAKNRVRAREAETALAALRAESN